MALASTPSTFSRPPYSRGRPRDSLSSSRRPSANACEHVFLLTTPPIAEATCSPNQQQHNFHQMQRRGSTVTRPAPALREARDCFDHPDIVFVLLLARESVLSLER